MSVGGSCREIASQLARAANESSFTRVRPPSPPPARRTLSRGGPLFLGLIAISSGEERSRRLEIKIYEYARHAEDTRGNEGRKGGRGVAVARASREDEEVPSHELPDCSSLRKKHTFPEYARFRFLRCEDLGGFF